jgi:hypothetical protein
MGTCGNPVFALASPEKQEGCIEALTIFGYTGLDLPDV